MVLRLKTRESRSSPGLPRTGVFDVAPQRHALLERGPGVTLGLSEPHREREPSRSPLLRVGSSLSLRHECEKLPREKSPAAFLRLKFRQRLEASSSQASELALSPAFAAS